MPDIPSDPDALVTQFCEQWATGDYDSLIDYFAEDAIYHNIPMDPATGHAEIKAFLDNFAAMAQSITFETHRQLASGPTVMNERTDTIVMADGNAVALPVVGVFEIEDGKIAAWRDYFDMAQFTGG